MEENLRRKATECIKTLITDLFREFRESTASGARAGPSNGLPEEHEVNVDFQQDVLVPEFDFSVLDSFMFFGDEEARHVQFGLMNAITTGEGIIQQDQQQPGNKSSDLADVSKSSGGSQDDESSGSGNSGTC